jgi:hypothetical protein
MIVLVLLAMFFVARTNAQFYNGMHQPFGKNRIQYEQFDWQKFEYETYTIFFYGLGRNLAEFTAFEADGITGEMQRFFDYPLQSKKIQFVVYQKLEHFRQSNIGIPEGDESNVGGVTQLAGNKVFLYYDGDLNNLRKQIRSGIAQVLLSQMLFGDNWREMIKNSTLLNFPLWYTEGLKDYATETWSVQADDRLRDMILRNDYEKFNRLTGEEAAIAGQSLWYYIAETYGSSVIPNILYMSRVSRNVESGFLFVLGISFNTLLNDAKLYFQFRYETDVDGAQEYGDFSKIKTSKKRNYASPVLSDDGKYVAFSSNQLGRTMVHMQRLDKKRQRKVLKAGYRIDRVSDESYPVMDWNPATGQLAVVTEKRGHLFLYLIDPEKPRKKLKIELLRLEKVLEIDYAKNGKSIAMSAINKGQSDIYLYSVAGNGQKQLTDDIFDDRYPSFWNDDQIIFSSNRTTDSLFKAKKYLENIPALHFDLFSVGLNKDPMAQRLTNTPLSDETHAQKFSNNQFTYISDESGIKNRYRGFLDSTILSIDTAINYRYFTKSEPLSGYARGVQNLDFLPSQNMLLEQIFYNGVDRFILKEGDEATQAFEPFSSNYRQLIEQPPLTIDQPEKIVKDSSGITLIRKKVFEETPVVETDNGLVDIYDYKFDSDVVNNANTPQPKTETKSPKPKGFQVQLDSIKRTLAKPFRIPEQRNYNIAFAATNFTTQVDFDYATQLYQRFNGGPYINAGLGPFIKLSMDDVFEDYLLEGGFRYSFNANGTEYFIALTNRVKRWDKKYILQRQTMSIDLPFQMVGKNEMYQGKAILKFPIDEVNAVQFTGTGRYDRQITLARDDRELLEPDQTDIWAGLKLEYIFDNTLYKSLNILNGARVKGWAEHYREVVEPSLHTTVIGIDARHYQPIFRDLIWANRLAASSSFGTRKLIYYLGSVDDWLILNNNDDPSPRFDRSTNIAQNEGYYFQTIATNMRGFKQNARNGNNFAVLNSELRWPVVRFFTDKPLKSEFLANLQIIGFADVGTAWNGPNPYSDENAFNNIVVTNGSATVRYKNQNDPILGSLGWGLRTKIWGYFARIDFANGIENGKFIDSKIHLSIGLDF